MVNHFLFSEVTWRVAYQLHKKLSITKEEIITWLSWIKIAGPYRTLISCVACCEILTSYSMRNSLLESADFSSNVFWASDKMKGLKGYNLLRDISFHN